MAYKNLFKSIYAININQGNGKNICLSINIVCRRQQQTYSRYCFDNNFKETTSILSPKKILNINSSFTNTIKNTKRFYCDDLTKIASYEEVKNIPNKRGIVLIDVREPHELQETGKIPMSINIPLGDISKMFSNEITSETFRQKYGIEKPNANQEIICFCRIGKRSHTAMETITGFGYKNVKNYKGSWIEWAEKEGLPK